MAPKAAGRGVIFPEERIYVEPHGWVRAAWILVGRPRGPISARCLKHVAERLVGYDPDTAIGPLELGGCRRWYRRVYLVRPGDDRINYRPCEAVDAGAA